ncbi:MAG: hypothetical protein EBY62_12850, partial [Cellvibrionales bacterium]|nr:hypothetical protein [Cellvibrionales bacterium]
DYVKIGDEKIHTSLLTLLKPLTPISEAYRQFRTNIQFSRPDAVIQVLLGTSATAGEGKTTTNANLAIVMAQSDRKTLLVDCDLRRPRMHRVFQMDKEPGLIDLLFENERAVDVASIDWNEALASYESEFPSLKGMKPIWGGFFWFQGWNDMFDENARAQYEDNLVCLIKDVRKHLQQPLLPVVVGELGNMGEDAGANMQMIRDAQRKACQRKEWKGRVSFVKTTEFARPKEESPNVGHGHHWFGNAESYFLIGDALGKEMIRLLQR